MQVLGVGCWVLVGSHYLQRDLMCREALTDFVGDVTASGDGREA